MQHPKEERTVVLVKPDGVMRGLVGEVLTRFEKRGLKILGLKMVYPSREHAAAHYSGSEEWLRGMGNKTLEAFAKYGIDVTAEMGTADALEIGKKVQQWNVDYLAMGPVVAIVLQGMHAITTVRKIVGSTLPVLADPGTIRGDFSVDSNVAGNFDKRAIHNIVHASGDPSEAGHEIAHWFKEEELIKYSRADEQIMFG
ncbi:MAG: nucleoside-diphosphate kinase [Patescibacteria group bacterium]